MRAIHCWLIAASLVAPLAHADLPLAEWQYSAGQSLRPFLSDEVPEWQGVVAAGPMAVPRYEGSSAYEVRPAATLELRWRDRAYASTAEGIGFNLLVGKGYRAGASLGLDLGRDEDDDDRLRGMGDLDPAAEAKLYGEVVFFPVTLRAAARRTLDSGGGWMADLSAYLPLAGSETFFAFAGPVVSLADGRAQRRAFGVDTGQAARSQFAAYRPDGGLRSAGLGLSATWLFHEHWLLNGTAGFQRLLGDAADSPLSLRDEQYGLSLMLGYRW